MFDSYVIETRKGAAGIVVRDRHGFRFFAATRHFSSLEGKLFETPKEAETAAVRQADGVRRRARTPEQLDLAMQRSVRPATSREAVPNMLSNGGSPAPEGGLDPQSMNKL
jgi:hypothetical protein